MGDAEAAGKVSIAASGSERGAERGRPPGDAEAAGKASLAALCATGSIAGRESARGAERGRPPGDAAEQFDAVILAGGRGRRLGGTDKPALVVGGRSMAASVLSAVAEAEQVIVVGPRRPELRGVRPGGLRFVQEEPPGSGPIPALRRGIAEVAAPWVAVLAADMPFLRGADLRRLRDAARGADSGGADSRPGGAGTAVLHLPGAVLVDDGGRPQWLAGCWRTATLRSAIGAYRGRSMHGLLAPLRPAEVPPDPEPGGPPPWLDCDTAGDLRGAHELFLRTGLG